MLYIHIIYYIYIYIYIYTKIQDMLFFCGQPLTRASHVGPAPLQSGRTVLPFSLLENDATNMPGFASFTRAS